MITTRRTLLGAIAGSGIALSAGCLGDTDEAGDDRGEDGTGNSNDDSNVTASGDDTDGEDNSHGDNENTARTLSLASVDDNLDVLAFEVEVVTNRLSATEMPTLDIRLENVGDEVVSWEQTETDFVFPSWWTEPSGLALSTVNKIEHFLEDGDGCRRVDGLGFDDVVVTTELEPGEALEQRYAVVGSESAIDDQCPPADVYRAEYEYAEYGMWGFTLKLE